MYLLCADTAAVASSECSAHSGIPSWLLCPVETMEASGDDLYALIYWVKKGGGLLPADTAKEGDEHVENLCWVNKAEKERGNNARRKLLELL